MDPRHGRRKSSRNSSESELKETEFKLERHVFGSRAKASIDRSKMNQKIYISILKSIFSDHIDYGNFCKEAVPKASLQMHALYEGSYHEDISWGHENRFV